MNKATYIYHYKLIPVILRKAIIILLLTIAQSKSFSQTVIQTDNIFKTGDINISSNVCYYENNQKINIDSVLSLKEFFWKKNERKNNLNLKISNNVYWLRFRIKNNLNKPIKFYILHSNKGINNLELYANSNNQLNFLGKTGDYLPFNKRPFRSTNFVFPISLNANEQSEYYMYCDKQNENLNTSIHLYNESRIKKKEEKTLLFMGIFLGFLALSFTVTLSLFLFYRQKLQLWYSFYILSVINILMSYEGFDFEFLFPNHPFYANISRFISSSITIVLMMYVMQLFCNQKPNNSKLFYVTRLIMWFIGLSIPATLIIYCFYPYFILKKIHFYSFMIQQSLGLLIVLSGTIEKMIQRFKPAIFYFIAVVMLLYSGILASFREMGIINYSSDTPNQLQWCFVFEIMLISIGMLYRYTLIKKENETLFQELNQQKINSLKQVFQTQQEEQQRIAEDLHDLFGGQLAALKLKINSENISNAQKEEISGLIDQLSTNTRNIAHNLAPIHLHNNAISDIISVYIKQLNKEQKTQFQFIQIGEPINFKKELEIDLYKILMEFIHNILKHANASEAGIQFFFKENELDVLIEDNGKGISFESTQGMGINNIKKRVKKLNGKVHIDSKPGNTTIIINIPLTDE